MNNVVDNEKSVLCTSTGEVDQSKLDDQKGAFYHNIGSSDID